MLSMGKGENRALIIYRSLLVCLLPHRASYGPQPSGSPAGLYRSVDDGNAISAHGCTLHYGRKYGRSANRGL